MGFIMKGLKVVIGLVVLFVLLGAIFGNHTSTPAATTSQPTDTKTAYTRDNVNFISKDRVDENIKLGVAKSGDYKEVQVPLNTVVVGGYSPESASNQVEQTPLQQTQSSANPSSSSISTSSTIKIGEKYPIVSNGSYFGCVDEKQMENIMGYLRESDQTAALKALNEGKLDGTIISFEPGQIVFVEANHGWWNGLIQVRPEGETQSYWTLIGAVGGKA